MRRSRSAAREALCCAFAMLLLVGAAAEEEESELFVWVGESGHTYMTDDPDKVPAHAAQRAAEEPERGELWRHDWRDDRLLAGPPAPGRGGASSAERRIRRLLNGALADLRRGETARGAAVFESILRLEPRRPEAHWYLGLLDSERGRQRSARRHFETFLAHAGGTSAEWRVEARRRLRALGAEEHAYKAVGPERLRFHNAESPHFLIRYDRQLAARGGDYEAAIVRYLEEAHRYGRDHFGVVPAEPTRVVLYGRVSYAATHGHRFSFPTVGFFDGRIHVASPTHPAGALRGLLYHEYSHALYRERSGGNRPYWLNEGWAELAERAARRRAGLNREELQTLREHIAAGSWIPLEQLAAGFQGLGPERARLAYLEATAAAAWLDQRGDAATRRALLDRLGAGEDVDAALRELYGLTTAEIDGALRRAVRDRAPVL